MGSGRKKRMHEQKPKPLGVRRESLDPDDP
jgi:hypothetical protein